MSRTLVDIPDNLLGRVNALAKVQDISRAELVRRALEQYVETTLQNHPENDPIEATRGLWKNREDIGDGVEYQRRLREEWDR